MVDIPLIRRWHSAIGGALNVPRVQFVCLCFFSISQCLIGGLGPGGLDSDRILENERETVT